VYDSENKSFWYKGGEMPEGINKLVKRVRSYYLKNRGKTSKTLSLRDMFKKFDFGEF